MKKLLYILCLLFVISLGYSCQDENMIYVGSSLNDTDVNVVVDSSFTLSGKSVLRQRIESRTASQLLGVINADNYGALHSDVVTQFMPSGKIDTTHVTVETIDSTRMVMYVAAHTGFFGDSIVPMQMSVYKLNKPLPTTMYSDFDPTGYYSESDLLAVKSYSASDLQKSLTEKVSHYIYDQTTGVYHEIRQVPVTLPNEIGKSIFSLYLENPEALRDPKEFAKLFPGLYIKSSFGSGRVMNFYDTEVEVFFRRCYKNSAGNDTVVRDSTSYLAATPEVLTNNNRTSVISDKIKRRVSAGEPIIMAPAAYEVEFNFPVDKIINRYNNEQCDLKVLNAVTLNIPIEKIQNDYDIAPPKYVLLIKKSQRDEFFEKKKLPDEIETYVAEYSELTKSYYFSGLRNYVLKVMEEHVDGVVNHDDTEFLLVPVDLNQVSSSSSSYYYYYNTPTTYTTLKVMPQVSTLALGKFDFENAEIVLTFTTQKVGTR